jgi:hypothetical protein
LLSLASLKTLHIRHGNPLSETSLNVYIPQLKKGGVSIPRPKTSLGVGRGEFLLIPLVAFIAALVVVLLFPPTRGGRRRGLLRSGLIVGVVFTGLYTLWLTFAMTFDVAYLEDLLFWVWIPGLALYSIMILVVIIGRLESKVKPPAPLSVPCHNCGQDNPAEARFCGNCGASLAAEVELPSPTAAPRRFAVQHRWIFIGVLAILVVILIGYGITSLFRAPPPPPLPPPALAPRPSPLPAPAPLSITFPDENLEAAIREVLGKKPGEEMTAAELAKLRELDASNRRIDSLPGIEHLVNLTSLDLGENQISEISPLENLTRLYTLSLEKNEISDITPLSNLANLTELWLWDNQISDIYPLASLTNLTRLGLWGNQISDITPLSNLTSLTWLSLEHNEIRDISPISNLANLTELWLWNNQISDLTPLKNLTSLTWLRLRGNQISDISPLQNLTSLTGLGLKNNEISDITPLSNLTNLTELWLLDNQISDISPLVENSGLGAGDEVWLEDNKLDLSEGSEDMENIGALEDVGVVVRY